MHYFLLIYDQLEGEVLELREFQAHERPAALQAWFQRETETLGQAHIEAVLLGAESAEALQKTHARYFQTASEIARAGR
ncbi:MAG: hypothetical protein ACRDZ4_13800 [Egibacteraceae bacterium]